MNTPPRVDAYLAAALNRAAVAVASAPPGDRNDTLNREAYAIGQLLAAGLPRAAVEATLVGAAMGAGLAEREARATVARSLSEGARTPREIPAGGRGGRRWATLAPLPTPAPIAAPPPTPPDPRHVEEAAALWARAVPATEDAELGAWLVSRGLDPAKVAERDLMRALPAGDDLPRWCAHWPGEARRGLLRVWTERGGLATLRGRCLGAAPEGLAKTKGPPGEPMTGRVYACPGGHPALQGWACELDVLHVVEGDPDFLTLATTLAYGRGVGVIGVWSGALTPHVMARFEGCRALVLWPHRDDAGGRMMRRGAEALPPRCPAWWVPFDGAHDANDTLRAGGVPRLVARFNARNPHEVTT